MQPTHAMTQDHRPHSTFLFVPVALFLATGCGQTQDPVDGSFEDGLGGETGNLPQDFGSGELESGECISDPREGVYGIKHQCDGWFFARIGYTYEGDSPWFPIPEPDTVSFGPDDEPYEQAKVMACCGEAEEGKTFYEQPHFAESCLLDFRQQACISLAIGLQ